MVAVVFSEHWGEIVGVFAFVIAIMVTLSTANTWAVYGTGLILGLMLGRLWFRYRKNLKTPAVLIISGAVLGLMLGSLLGNLYNVLLSVVVGIGIGYLVHQQRWIESTEY